MNRYIKNKKKDKLNHKKSFTKEDLLFLKKYPRLYPICKVNNINYSKANGAFKKINKLGLCTKEEIQCAIRMIVAAEERKYTFKKNSKGDSFKKLFSKLDIKFRKGIK